MRSLPTWHIRLRPSIRGVLVGAGVWLLCVSALHMFINHHSAMITRAEAHPVQMGGLPIT